MARVITASTLVGNELADRCTAEVQGAGKHHRSAVAEESGIELLRGGIDATDQRPRQLRHAADHRGAVEVMAAGTARAIAGEQQRTTVRGEHRCELVGRTVHRGAQILRFAESTVASNADPVQIVAALAACAVRAEIHRAAIGRKGGIEVSSRRVERDRRRRPPALPIVAGDPDVIPARTAGTVAAEPQRGVSVRAQGQSNLVVLRGCNARRKAFSGADDLQHA
ncbi:hypothetical protein A9K70_16660 [Stenotrophomonas maltophilia]|nr:hypothetical protein [Stenotrophomonas maltophilia]OBU56301.1 hypothetical protein A9K70_16660 [Stenotrophomonas maltophilia]